MKRLTMASTAIALVVVAVLGIGWNQHWFSGSVPGNQQTNTNATAPTSTGPNQTPVPMKYVRDGNHVTIDMTTEETSVNIAPGVSYHAWTFDGLVPGPVIQLQQGDHVTLRLHNQDPTMAHSIDLHAVLADPSTAFTPVDPGKTKTIQFTAAQPGVYMYHCSTDPMLMHIGNGMYGAVVITPKDTSTPTYTIVQSEFYQNGSYTQMMNGSPKYVVFNGEADKYLQAPLTAKVGVPMTVAFVNAGPNEFSAFHVVGAVIHEANASGNPANVLRDVQTVTVAPGDGYLFHITFTQPGTYTFVSHAMSSMAKGAVGKIVVTK